MTRTEHLLVCLAEECNEVAQRASKALRFGLAEVEPGQEKTNARRIADEMNDVVAVYQMLAGPVVSSTTPLFAYGTADTYMADVRAKVAKIERYLAYSRECGTLQD
jgi:NTP pyrophosphatase (non-canonical NTP hydrolase)